jgi:hypothetical protein
MNTAALQSLARDLTRQAPRSPRVALGGYPGILARIIDKCRANLLERSGDYHYNCGLDRRFFKTVGLDADALQAFIASGADDPSIAAWVRDHARVPHDKAAAWLRLIVRNPLLRLLDLDDWLHERRQRRKG